MSKKIKLLSSIFILSWIMIIFSIIFLSFGILSSKKESINSYDSSSIVSYDNFATEELGWSLEQMHTSTGDSTSNSSVILTDPEGTDYAYIWGDNSYGQLGLGMGLNEFKQEPTLIEFDIEYSDIKFLSINSTSSLAVLTDESGEDFLYAWGNNEQGQLGLGKTDIYEIRVPTLVTNLPPYDEIKSIEMGENATGIVLTIDDKDTLWTTGYNGQYSALGLGDNREIFYDYTEVQFPKPIYEIKNFSLDSSSTLVATDESGKNILYTWGSNDYFQSGQSIYNKEPVDYGEIYPGYEIKEVKSTGRTTMAILINPNGKDDLYAWGNNSYGQIGIINSEENNYNPTLVEFPSIYAEIKNISMGATTSSAITIDSSGKEHIYLWGDNSNYLMGNKNLSDNFLSPTEIKFSTTSDYAIKEISLGQTHAGMIVDYKGSNQLYMWGNAFKGALGTGGDTSGYKTISEIKKWDQTPQITFINESPTINKEKNGNKTLSFTLDWDKTVLPTQIDLINYEGNTIYEVPFTEVKSGIKTEIDISDIAPEGIDNVRLKVSNKDNTLVISQSFNIPDSYPVKMSVISIIVISVLSIIIIIMIIVIIKKLVF